MIKSGVYIRDAIPGMKASHHSPRVSKRWRDASKRSLCGELWSVVFPKIVMRGGRTNKRKIELLIPNFQRNENKTLTLCLYRAGSLESIKQLAKNFQILQQFLGEFFNLYFVRKFSMLYLWIYCKITNHMTFLLRITFKIPSKNYTINVLCA